MSGRNVPRRRAVAWCAGAVTTTLLLAVAAGPAVAADGQVLVSGAIADFDSGIAHEIGHTFGLDHPDVVDCGDKCALNGSSLMYLGYLDLRNTYLLGSDKTKLLASPFVS